MITIRDRILLLLEKKNITKTEFANKLNITQAYVSKITNKGATPSDRLIEDICEKFMVNENWLRTGNGEMFIKLDKENQLMIWAANILKDESDSFKRRFVQMLTEFDESDWETLEKICVKLHKES